MKTAISIDEQLFQLAESFSQTYGYSRSGLYCAALQEYISNHKQDIITEKLNEYYANHESGLDDASKEVNYRLFSGEDW